MCKKLISSNLYFSRDIKMKQNQELEIIKNILFIIETLIKYAMHC